MSSEIVNESHPLANALSRAGQNDRLREVIFNALRVAESHAEDPATFREQVRWPLILSLLHDAKTHRVVLQNGIVFDVSPDSRIEKALLLSSVAHPDHVWEPQTTKLLTTLAVGAANVIVGGAYIGDHVLPIARATKGTVHAFEPMQHAFDRLCHHLEINDIENVVAQRFGLWNQSHVLLGLDGHLALASSVAIDNEASVGPETPRSITIDDYVRSRELTGVALIMLDTEGGEERALLGAEKTIARDSPNIVFEIHRNFVDWTDGLENTSIVKFLISQNYEVFAIRDFHNNYPMATCPVEIIPVSKVYVEGPPHGFNVLATKDKSLVNRLGLRIVANVSPKLLLDKDRALHFPLSTLEEK